MPKPRLYSQSEDSKAEPEVEGYRVIIKKQPKKSVTERLLQKGLLDPARAKTPETTSQTPEVNDPYQSTDSEPTDTDPDITNESRSSRGTWSCTFCVDEPHLIPSSGDDIPAIEDDLSCTMLPINEGAEEIYVSTYTIRAATPDPVPEVSSVTTEYTYTQITAPTFVPTFKREPRLCRRGRYAKRCLNRALASLKSPQGKAKPRLMRRPRYFERIFGDIKRSVSGDKEVATSDEAGLLRILMLTSLAYSLRDTYDTEILHRGSSRRNSRRASASCRRESNVQEQMSRFESDLLAFKAKKEAESLSSFAAGRRRLSVMSMVVADKVGHAMRTDLARGLAYAMVPCASALAFFMFNYTKRLNNNE